jgi:hypothetical protein
MAVLDDHAVQPVYGSQVPLEVVPLILPSAGSGGDPLGVVITVAEGGAVVEIGPDADPPAAADAAQRKIVADGDDLDARQRRRRILFFGPEAHVLHHGKTQRIRRVQVVSRRLPGIQCRQVVFDHTPVVGLGGAADAGKLEHVPGRRGALAVVDVNAETAEGP